MQAAIAAVFSATLCVGAAGAVIPFKVAFLDIGIAPGTLGSPITWTGPGHNRAFTSGAGSIRPPSADLIDVIPRVRWDDYFMFDPIGQSDGGDPAVVGDGHTATGPTFVVGASIDAGMASGLTYYLAPEGLPGMPASEDGRCFLLNITLREGSGLPVTNGAYINILRENNVANTGFAFTALKFGIENATNQAVSGDDGVTPYTTQRFYYLDWIATAVPASELPASFGAGVNYQIFVQQSDVPTPTATTFFGLAASLTVRRRRKAL